MSHDGVSAVPQRMRSRRWRLVALAAVLAAVLAGCQIPVAPVGPFYEPPGPIDGDAPGTVLRVEPIADGLPAGVLGWRVLYVSTAWDTGAPVAVSGTVYAPDLPAPAAPRPVLAWAHPTTGVASTCAPSPAPGGGASGIPGLQEFVKQGWVVAATDYPGLGTQGPHPYLVGTSEAYAVIDSVRAAGAIPELAAGSRYVVFGHSQGGHAAAWTGQVAGDYAPDLSLLGVAAAAPATELGTLFDADVGTISGDVLSAYTVASWASLDIGLDSGLVVRPEFEPVVFALASLCVGGADPADPILIGVLVAALGGTAFLEADPVTTPPWSDFVAENTPGRTPLGAPLLVVQGEADTVVEPAATAEYVSAVCAQGTPTQYLTVPGIDHDAAGLVAAPVVTVWAQDRFDGVPPPSNCFPRA